MITILIADGQQLFLSGLILLIKAEPDLEIVGEAADAEQALTLAAQLAPKVMLVDLDLPGGGIRTISELRLARPEIRLVALSNRVDAPWVRSAIAAGIHAFVMKKDSPSNLFEAVRAASSGRAWISFSLDEDLRALLNEPAKHGDLAPREAEVLRLMVLGYTYKVIGEDLGMSIKTIEGYRTRICERLGLETRADLVRFSLEIGLLASPKLG